MHDDALSALYGDHRSSDTDAPPQATRPRPSQATQLIELANAVELWHTPEGDAYASCRVNDHLEHWPVKGKAFRTWLAQQFYVAARGAPSAQALHDALAVMEAKARFEGAEHPVHVRLARLDETVYLDLCNERWEAVAIDSTGWRVIAAPPIRFRRSRGMLPLPRPTPGGTVADLQKYLNLDHDRPEDWTLLLTWVLAALQPRGPYPVLVIHGEQGSGKSSLVRSVRSLIDPNTSPLRSPPRDARDLMIAASNGWILAYDNLSHIDPWLSDAFCRLATGGGLSTRELYSDAEEVLLDAQRPVILNGIEELATRGDLLDRSIVIYLPTIPPDRRRTEAELDRTFEEDRPRLLGALLTVVSGAMRELTNVKPDRLPRLADFAVWGTAVDRALGMSSGTFLTAYGGNCEAANDLTLEASPVVAPLHALLSAPETPSPWMGTASELLAALDNHVDDQVRRLRAWPATPRALSNALRRLTPNLRAAGIAVNHFREAHTGRRLIRLDWMGALSSPSSPSSPSVSRPFGCGDRRDSDLASCHPVTSRQSGPCDAGDDGDATGPPDSGDEHGAESWLELS